MYLCSLLSLLPQDDIILIKMIEAYQIPVFCTLPSGIQKTDTMEVFKCAGIVFLNAFLNVLMVTGWPFGLRCNT